MHRRIKLTFSFSISTISIIFMFINDDFWQKINIFKINNNYTYWNGIINKIILFMLVIFVWGIIFFVIGNARFIFTIRDKNYSIQIRYCNILKMKKGIHVINFDECFTTKIGSASGDVRESSICGQYLKEHKDLDITTTLKKINIKPEIRKSKYLKQKCYKPGTIVPYNGDLLMAFVKLVSNGLAKFDTIEDYKNCLSFLWHQIYIYHGDSSVCVPILGSGKTEVQGKNLSSQEILDIMIYSYKTSDYRLKAPYKLYICCKRKKDLSLWKIGEAL